MKAILKPVKGPSQIWYFPMGTEPANEIRVPEKIDTSTWRARLFVLKGKSDGGVPIYQETLTQTEPTPQVEKLMNPPSHSG